MYQNRRSTYTNFILIFVAIKVVLNMVAMPHFGFQRDELLHLALGDHLAWGYKEVPPVIALLARVSTTIFGDSIFATRIFSTIFAGLIIWFTGLITVELGGRKFAITLACLAMIFSPAFVATQYLFQPVVFDQFWWVLTVYLIIKYINSSSVKYLYFIGIAVGLGLLTKYTMGFFAIALIGGLLITKQRRLLFNKHVLGAILVALILFLPNIIWQYQHHLPVITHMKTLRSSQLDYIKPGDFISQQIMVNGIALFLWLTGFFFLIFSFKLRKYQFLAFAYILIFLFLLEMSGKNYYLFGAYPMLFAAGGYAFERWIKNGYVLRTIVIMLFTLPNVLLLPMLLPVLPLNQTLAVFRFSDKHLPILSFAAIWEDHKKHLTTQDYGDMLGWDELAKKVADTYHTLTPDQQKQTIIIADNYGEAGAIHHYGKQYNLPDAISLDSSFALWAPGSISARYIIFVDDNDGNNAKKIAPAVDSCQKTGSIDNPLAREIGTGIYLFTQPKPVFNAFYKKELARRLAE